MLPLPSACFSNGCCSLLLRWLKSLSLKNLNSWRFVFIGVLQMSTDQDYWARGTTADPFGPRQNAPHSIVWQQAGSPWWSGSVTLLSTVSSFLPAGPATHGARNSHVQLQLQFTRTTTVSHLEAFFLWTSGSLEHEAEVLPMGYWVYL